MGYDYFYDAQIKRYLQQIIKAFSGFKYRTGRTVNGVLEERIVPCRMATQNRMVASLMKNGSDNTLLAVPLITVAQTGFARKQVNDGNHSFVGTLQVAERGKDPVTGDYTHARGQGYTIQRLMPLPFEMTVQVDIWTSNMDQKHQLMEQILVVTGREFDIQNSDNAVDWAALTMMSLLDVAWTNRSVQIGTEDEIEIATLTYSLPVRLNPPAKITRQVLINEVRTNVDTTDEPTGDGLFSQTIVTPNDYRIAIDRGTITLLGADDLPKAWSDLSTLYKTAIANGVTMVRLKKSSDPDAMEVVGTIFSTDDPTKVEWQIDIDTLPSNTLPPINAIIRPHTSVPGENLPEAANGQRYLVYEDMGSSEIWGTVNARKYDIIGYVSGSWIVVTRVRDLTDATVLNSGSGSQLHWNGTEWEKAIDGIYGPEYWRIFL